MAPASLATRLAAVTIFGGTGIYADLVKGDRFRFTTSDQRCQKIAGPWYVVEHRPGFKFRTGRGTAIVRLP